jgi:NTP pyrophosphatase (non-canonical NTP hydrolase)
MPKSMAEWQAEIKAFNDAREWSKPEYMKDFLLNIIEEVGEARNIIKWLPEAQSPALIRQHQADWEDFIGQLQYLVFKMSYLTDISAEEAVRKVMAEFSERFPIDKVKGTHANTLAGGHDGKYAAKGR